jgi:protein-tyrosine phosphatase
LITQIEEHVFLGDATDALSWGGRTICVLESRPVNEPAMAICMPILKHIVNSATHQLQLQTMPDGALQADLDMLSVVANLIARLVGRKEDVLVHCGSGVERSPLAIVWFLHEYRGMSIEEAYKLVRQKRPEVADRRIWLPSEELAKDVGLA